MIAAPEGSPPRRIGNKQFKKPLPAVPRRGPEAGFHRIHYDFHGSGVNPIDSCLFLQSRFIVYFCDLAGTLLFIYYINIAREWIHIGPAMGTLAWEAISQYEIIRRVR